MSRPIKYGLDYIPLPTDLAKEERLVLAEMGLVGFAIYSIVIRETAKRGYYMEITDNNLIELSEKMKIPVKDIRETLDRLAEKDILDKKLLNKGIITGYELQQKIFELYKKLKRSHIQNKYIIQKDTVETKEKKAEDKKLYAENSEEYILAKTLFENIREMNPGHKIPDLQKWCEETDKMLRIDKRDFREAMEVLEYLKTDEFWKKNILSTAKLRAHYDQLKIKKDGKSKNYTKPSKFTNKEVVKL
jgi:hypothetical protein